MEKSDKFSKIPSSHYILEYEFILTHLYSNIGSSFTCGKIDLVYFIPKRIGYLRVLCPLSPVHHCTKPGKKYCASIQSTCTHHLPKSKKILNFQKWQPLSNCLKKSKNWTTREFEITATNSSGLKPEQVVLPSDLWTLNYHLFLETLYKYRYSYKYEHSLLWAHTRTPYLYEHF
jgi:hypothetical protein